MNKFWALHLINFISVKKYMITKLEKVRCLLHVTCQEKSQYIHYKCSPLCIFEFSICFVVCAG